MIREALEPIGLTDGLSSSLTQRLADLAACTAWPEQEMLFRESETHEKLSWIKQGRVRLEMSGTRSVSRALLTLGPGDMLAWSAFLGDGRMTATAITATPTTLISFDADELLKLCEEEPEIGCRVMRSVATSISKRLLATRLQLLDLFHQPSGADK